jgi:hypothetical protein
MVLNRAWVSMLALATIAAGELGAQGRGRAVAVTDTARLDSLRALYARVALRMKLQDWQFRNQGPGLLLYGFALECTPCEKPRLRWDTAFVRVRPDSTRIVQLPFYNYSEPPRVAALAPGGAAERAGILVDDSLIAVNGVSILTPSGMQLLRGVRAGDDVTLTLRRGGGNVDVTMLLSGLGEGRGGRAGRGGRGGLGGRGALPADEPALPLRFAGNVGATPVEVMSDTPITVDMEAGGDLVIHVAGSTVRVHPSGPGGRGGGRGRAARP